MKNLLTIFAFLYFSLNLFGQDDINLEGVVVLQNSKYKTGKVQYISKASIQATQATATLSDANGQFILTFSDKPAYNVTRVFVQKSGLEVINKTDLEQAAVIGRNSKFKIIMCDADELVKNQILYYGIAEEAIVKRFKNRIAALETANTNLDQLIAKVNADFNLEVKGKTEAIYALEKEWSKALEQAQKIAERFAAINLDDANELLIQADEAFRKGDFDKVLEIMNYDLLEKNFQNIQANLNAADKLGEEGKVKIAKGKENLRQSVENAVFAARVAQVDGAYKRAEDYFDLAVEFDSLNHEVVFEFALFLQKQNQFKKAQLGYEQVLTIYRTLAKKNPYVYLPRLTNSLNNLGLLLADINEMDMAKAHYEEALKINKTFVKNNPGVFLPNMANILSNLGNLQRLNNEMNMAKANYKKSLQIRRTLVKENPDMYLPYMAITLNN